MTGSPFALAAQRVASGASHHDEAATLVASMTIDERLGCLDGDTPFWPGLLDMLGGGYYRHAWPAAHVDRLGVPGIDFADGPRGCVIGAATAFPVSMARGATFDPELEERVGDAIGAELRASGATYTGAVCMNLLRHPAWGRAQETYGEDPHHVGEMAVALTRGLQRHVLACMKHFALNSMENARFRVDVTVDERALHEVYLSHFRRVADAGVASVMSAYNSVNGSWCGESTALLTDILRDEWDWDGFVTSDFIFGVRDAAASVRAGLDIEMPLRMARAMQLSAALDEGRLNLADIDAAVVRVVATLLRFAWVFQRRPDPSVIASPDHRALARDVAARSTVLLRNETVDGVEGDRRPLLPLDRTAVRRVAVVGRLAAVANLGDGGSSDVHPPSVVTPLEGLRAALGDVVVDHSDDDTTIVDGADVAVVVVGFTKADEGEYLDTTGTATLAAELFPPMDDPQLGVGTATTTVSPARGEPTMALGGDRRSLRLSTSDEALIAAVRDRGVPTVVVVMGGSAVVMPWAVDVDAILHVWYPGMEGGRALAAVLLGDDEPGGRLPFAVPADEADLVPFDPDADAAVYDLFHGQWHLDRIGHQAAYPFGHGLGYTRFGLRDAVVDGDRGEVTVVNTGDRPGSTVVFVFAGMTESRWERPARRLIGFRRITVDVAAIATVELPLDWSALAVRSAGRLIDEPGRYEVEIGLHAHDPQAITLTADR
ncbi:MAG: beta-glucosidase [Ilumatobacteraceae bacterium]